MNYQLIKNGCQSFFNDVGIEIDNFDEVVNEIYEIIKEIRSESPDFYDYICESNGFTQLRGLYIYLSERFEIESDSIIITSKLEEGFTDFMTDTGVVDSTVFSLIFKALTSALGFVAGGVLSVVKIPLITLAVIIGITLNTGTRYVPDRILSLFNTFGKALRSTGDAISNLGKTWTYRYAFILSKFNECAPKCGMKDIKDLRNKRMWIPILTYGQSGDRESAEKIECLVDCFFANLIELIVLNVRGHMTCLLNTNKLSDFKRLDSKEILQKIRVPSSDMENPCYVYFDISKKLMDTLEEAMEVAYHDRPQNKKKILDLLDKQIFTAKKEVESQLSKPQFQRSPSKPFQK